MDRELIFLVTEANLQKLSTIEREEIKMKKIVRFDVNNKESLATALEIGIIGYGIAGSQVGRSTSLWLYLNDNTVLRVQAVVTCVDSWHEVGTLVFRYLTKHSDDLPKMVPVATQWSDIDFIEKLTLEEDMFWAESGLAIHNKLGEIMLIMPGAFPHTVEISAPFFAGDFCPEYELNCYERTRI